jgi:hypothetical protein
MTARHDARSQREARVAEEGSIAALCEKSRFLSGIDIPHMLSIKLERGPSLAREGLASTKCTAQDRR